MTLGNAIKIIRTTKGLKQKDLAASQFDAAVALNPDHVLAQTLADDARVPDQH